MEEKPILKGSPPLDFSWHDLQRTIFYSAITALGSALVQLSETQTPLDGKIWMNVLLTSLFTGCVIGFRKYLTNTKEVSGYEQRSTRSPKHRH